MYGCVLLPRAGRVVYLAMLRSTAVVAGAKARALSRPDRNQVRVSRRISGAHFTQKFGRMLYRESSSVWKIVYLRKYRNLFLSHINCQVG